MAFESLVRAYCVVPDDRGQTHIMAASGDELTLLQLSGGTLAPLWSKKIGRQMRDMARRHNLVVMGDNAGRVRVLDLSRPEDVAVSYLRSEIFARSVFSSVASLRWCLDDSGTKFSATLDDGAFQLRDVREL